MPTLAGGTWGAFDGALGSCEQRLLSEDVGDNMLALFVRAPREGLWLHKDESIRVSLTEDIY